MLDVRVCYLKTVISKLLCLNNQQLGNLFGAGASSHLLAQWYQKISEDIH